MRARPIVRTGIKRESISMNVRKKLIGIGFVLALAIGSVFPAHALLDPKFEAKTTEKQTEEILATLDAISKHYKSNPTTAYKAACMVDIHRQKASDII